MTPEGQIWVYESCLKLLVVIKTDVIKNDIMHISTCAHFDVRAYARARPSLLAALIRARARKPCEALLYFKCLLFFFLLLFSFFFHPMNCLFQGFNIPKNSWNFAYPPKVGRKISYFGGLAHERTEMALRRHLGFGCRRSPRTLFHPRGWDLEGVWNISRRTKKSLGDPGFGKGYGGHFGSKFTFLWFFGHFQGSYLNELLLGLSSDPFETWRVCSWGFDDKKLSKS